MGRSSGKHHPVPQGAQQCKTTAKKRKRGESAVTSSYNLCRTPDRESRKRKRQYGIDDTEPSKRRRPTIKTERADSYIANHTLAQKHSTQQRSVFSPSTGPEAWEYISPTGETPQSAQFYDTSPLSARTASQLDLRECTARAKKRVKACQSTMSYHPWDFVSNGLPPQLYEAISEEEHRWWYEVNRVWYRQAEPEKTYKVEWFCDRRKGRGLDRELWIRVPKILEHPGFTRGWRADWNPPRRGRGSRGMERDVNPWVVDELLDIVESVEEDGDEEVDGYEYKVADNGGGRDRGGKSWVYPPAVQAVLDEYNAWIAEGREEKVFV